MAAKTDAVGKKPGDAPTYEPEAQYRVKLTRVVDLGKGRFLRPGEDNVIKGKVATTIADAIERAERL